MNGLQITGFDVIEKVGAGGMATVWKARQKSLDRIVAIKVLHEHFATDPADIQRFQTEAQSAAKLKHQGIVQVYDANFESGKYYFIMEFVAGYTVGDWLRRKGKLTEKDALLVADCVSDALDYAWRTARIIHCDIKPDNVMVDADGAVKVSDLGLARTISVMTGEKKFTEEVLGTPAYISPEQAMGATDLDCRADIYSLGAMLYHLVTGHMMFENQPDEQVMELQVRDTVQDAIDLESGLSRGLCTMLEKMLAKKREDRYRDWADFRNDLARVKSKLPLFGSALPDGVSTMRRSTRRQKAVSVPRQEKREAARSGPPVALIAVGVGAALAIVIVIFWALSSRPPAPSKKTTVVVNPETLPTTQPGEDALARREATAKEMFENAQRLHQQNPTKYDEAVHRFQTVVNQARGTKYAQMAEDERKRIEGVRDDAIRKTLAELDTTAGELADAGKLTEAIAIYDKYSGPMASYTVSQRHKRVEAMRNRIAAAKRDEEAKKKAGEERFKALVAEVVQLLGHRDLSSAGILLSRAAGDPLLRENAESVKAIQKVVDGAGNSDQKVFDSFRAQKNTSVTVNLLTGPKTVTICEVKDGRIQAKQQIGADGLATVTIAFGLSDLAPAERLQRMGSDEQADVALAKGLSELAAGNPAGARKHLEKTLPLIGEPLMTMVDDLDRRRADDDARAALTQIVRMYEISSEPYNLDSWMAAAAKKTFAPDAAARLAEAIGAFRKKHGTAAFAVEAEPLLAMFNKGGKGDVVVVLPGQAPPKARSLTKVDSQGHPAAETWIRRNPALLAEDIGIFVDENEKVVRVEVYSPGVTDVSPAAAMKELKEFSCGGLPPAYQGTHPIGRLSNIMPLRSLPLESVYLGLTSVTDLSALSGTKLRELLVPCTEVSDISVARSMPLEKVDLRGTRVHDISVLRGKNITDLNLCNTRVVDFRPLSGMPLTRLNASGTLIVDLSVLKGMPMKDLSLSRTKVSSLAPLSAMSLTRLELNETVVRDLTPLRGVNTLAVLYAGSTDVTDIGPLTALPLTSLSLANTAVRDFSPLKSMPLRSLNLSGCHVSDISMLSGKSLEFVDLSGTRVSDLSPLQMSLTLRSLNIRNTQVSDLSPISKAPLSSLDCRGIPTADFSALRRMPIENLCIDQSPQVLPVLLSMPKLRYVNGVVWDRLSHVPGKMNRPTRKIRRDRDG